MSIHSLVVGNSKGRDVVVVAEGDSGGLAHFLKIFDNFGGSAPLIRSIIVLPLIASPDHYYEI